jgi:hypothetical protein
MLLRALPENRDERWRTLDAILRKWFPPPPAVTGVAASECDDAERRLRLSLPKALREWYEGYGVRAEVWSPVDRLLPPDEFRIVDNVLIFYRECQAVVSWGIRLQDLVLEDPPVVVQDVADNRCWLIESDTTSQFALQSALLNAKWSGLVAHRANGQLTDEAIRAITSTYRRLPFPDIHWPPFATRLFGGDEVLLETEADTWLWVTALNREAFEAVDHLARRCGMAWEQMSDE